MCWSVIAAANRTREMVHFLLLVCVCVCFLYSTMLCLQINAVCLHLDYFDRVGTGTQGD